ncbi:uncharacterized protein AB9X84_015554 [Acanthopagrus schlegelii]
MTLEWTRPDLKPIFVHMRRAGQDLLRSKHPSFTGRTSVSIDELKHGNISLKLSKVKPSDAGRYQCYIPKLDTGSVVELIVGAASSLVISLSEQDRNKGGLVLQCNSTGWYPEPEVFWLDGEGNLLSAGPTETVRGPDDLYTVSSRVTVEKRHSNSFTCRVQQNHINLIRETHIHVPEDFFQSSSSWITTGLTVSLAVCILVILILGFLLWRQYKTKTKRIHRDETGKGEMNQEGEGLVTKSKLKEEQQKLKEEKQQKLKEEQQKLKEEQQSREEAENRVQILEEELQKNRELQEEKKKREEEVQRIIQELQEKTDQMDGSKDETIKKERRDKEKAQSEVKMLKDQLESKNKEYEKKQAEVRQLQEQIQKMESGLQTLMKDLDSDTLERSPPSHSGRSWSGLTRSLSLFGGNKAQVQSAPLSKWPEMLRQKFQEKLQKKITEYEKQQAEVQQLQQQIQKMESGLQTLMKDLDSDTLENLKKHVSSVSGKSSTPRFQRSQSIPVQSSSSLWPEMLRQKFQEKLQKKITELQEEQNRRDKAEKVFLKKDLQYKTDQRESEKQVSSSLSQNSTRRLEVDVMIDPEGKYFQLKNTSTQDQQLGGWNLKIQVNNNKTIIHKLKEPSNLKAYQHFTVGCCGYDRSYPCAHLVLEDLNPLSHRDNLQVSLISYPEEIQYNLDHID